MGRTNTNGDWQRLPDAPFSPRSHMHYKVIRLKAGLNRLNNAAEGDGRSPTAPHSVLIIGGQTGHACSQHLLGICSSELWELRIAYNLSASFVGTELLSSSFSWSPVPVGSLPSPARCGASLLHDERYLTSASGWVLGIVGGQLSYDDEHNCSLPIISVNEAHYSSYPGLQWRRGRDAPFTPRRSMVEETAMVWDDEFSRSLSTNYELLRPLDKSAVLAGGIRYTQHRYDAEMGKAVMTTAEVYADSWACTLTTPEYDSSLLDCDWRHGALIGNSTSEAPFLPVGSLPVPVAHSSQTSYPREEDGVVSFLRFGGVSTEAAERAWKEAVPSSRAGGPEPIVWALMPSNATLLYQPLHVEGLADEPQSLQRSRFALPTAFVLSEAEMSDPASAFVAGSSAVIGHTLSTEYCKTNPVLSSVHWQRGQMLHTPDVDSWWLYSASSSLNTTRRHFDFSMQRIDHSHAPLYSVSIVAGGHSGAMFSNDWVTYRPQVCLWPDDPSYSGLLGPGFVPFLRLSNLNAWWVEYKADVHLSEPFSLPIFPQYAHTRTYTSTHTHTHAHTDTHTSQRRWLSSLLLSLRGALCPLPLCRFESVAFSCQPGFHLSPPLDDADYATLQCLSSGLWMDARLRSIRRCVPNRLQCAAPFRDRGRATCSLPLPVVSAVSVHTVSSFQHVVQADNPNPATVVGLPDIAGEPLNFLWLLSVEGQYLAEPVSVSVNNMPCSSPQLQNVTRLCSGQGADAVCDSFASRVVCLLDPELLNDESQKQVMPVVVSVGQPAHLIASIPLPYSLPRFAHLAWMRHVVQDVSLTVSLAPPVVTAIRSSDCVRQVMDNSTSGSSELRLFDCPTDRSFQLEVCTAHTSWGHQRELNEVSLGSAVLGCEDGWYELGQQLLPAMRPPHP